MEKHWVIGVGALCVVACGEAQPDTTVEAGVGSAEQGLVSQWIGPVSEEASKSSRTCPSDSSGQALSVNAARCVGSYCDDMSLGCMPLPGRFRALHNDGGSGWSDEISDEAPKNYVFCGWAAGTSSSPPTPSGYITGIAAAGRYADRIRVACTPLMDTHMGTACRWTPYFSEEQGTQQFANDEIAMGVACKGSYCDQMSFYVCRDVTIPDSLTNPPPSTECGTLRDGQGIVVYGPSLRSCDGRFELAVYDQGVTLLMNGQQLWNGYAFKPVSAVMGAEGNFVQYWYDGPRGWRSNTAGNYGSRLLLQNDGNLVIYNSANTPIWASNTCCH